MIEFDFEFFFGLNAFCDMRNYYDFFLFLFKNEKKNRNFLNFYKNFQVKKNFLTIFFVAVL